MSSLESVTMFDRDMIRVLNNQGNQAKYWKSMWESFIDKNQARYDTESQKFTSDLPAENLVQASGFVQYKCYWDYICIVVFQQIRFLQKHFSLKSSISINVSWK